MVCKRPPLRMEALMEIEQPFNSLQAATYLGIKEKTLGAWRARGYGPKFFRYSGRCVRYKKADLDAWLAQHRVEIAGSSGLAGSCADEG